MQKYANNFSLEDYVNGGQQAFLQLYNGLLSPDFGNYAKGLVGEMPPYFEIVTLFFAGRSSSARPTTSSNRAAMSIRITSC